MATTDQLVPALGEHAPRGKHWPIGTTRLKAGLQSKTLRDPWRQLRERAGAVVVKAVAQSAALGLILYFLIHQGFGVALEASAIYATLGVVGTFALRVVIGVGKLELDRDDWRRDHGVLRARIGAHLRVWESVDQAERDEGFRRRSPEYILDNLTANVTNALQMPGAYLIPQHVERVREIANGDDDASERVDELLSLLRENLVAGTYLRG